MAVIRKGRPVSGSEKDDLVLRQLVKLLELKAESY